MGSKESWGKTMIIKKEKFTFGKFTISVKHTKFSYNHVNKINHALEIDVFENKQILDGLYIPLGEYKDA